MSRERAAADDDLREKMIVLNEKHSPKPSFPEQLTLRCD